jgi:hypothetical protein
MLSRRRYAMMSFDVELIPEAILSSGDSTIAYDRRMKALGTKSNPYQCSGPMVNMHIDGISAEFAPRSPLTSPYSLMAVYREGKLALEGILGMPLVGRDWVDLQDVAGFDEENTPFLYEETQAFGCSPDYINGRARVVPRSVKERTVRELGLHFHLDLGAEYCDQRTEVQKAQGKPPTNTVIVAKVAAELARRTAFLFTPRHPRMRLWYRQPALYRPTAYGIEYRSFGSSICNDEDRMFTLVNVMHHFMKDHHHGTDVVVQED